MKLIKTRQRLFMVFVDTALTLLAWFGLLYLLIQGLWPLLNDKEGPRIDISFFEALNTLQIYLWVALFNAAVLVAWARYQQRKGRSFAQRRLAPPALGDEALSRSFRLSEDKFARMRASGSMIVHNDEFGGVREVITPLYQVAPDEQPAPLAPPLHPHVIRLPSEGEGKPD